MRAIQSIKKFLVSEDGPTAVEYAVMMALIIVVCITTVTAIGNNAKTQFVGGNAPSGEPFVGAIDSFRVFKVARTPAQIAAAAL